MTGHVRRYVENPVAGTGAVATVGGTLQLMGNNFGRFSDGLALFVALGDEKWMAQMPFVDCTSSIGTYVADYCIELSVPAGDGMHRQFYIVVGGQQCGFLEFSYADPVVQDLVVVQNPNDPLMKDMYVAGSNFGLRGRVFVGVGAFNDSATIAGGAGPTVVECVQVSYAHTQIVCKLLPVLVGGVNRSIDAGWLLVVAGVDARVSNMLQFTQLSPDITGMTPTSAGTAGGAVMTFTAIFVDSYINRMSLSAVIGGNLCPLDYSSFTELTDDSSPCPVGGGTCSPRSMQRATFTCTIPAGQGANLEVRIYRAQQQPSLPRKFSYFAPSFVLVNSSHASFEGPIAGWVSGVSDGWTTVGATDVTIIGTNFGLTPRLTVGAQTLDASLAHVVTGTVHTQLLFTLPPGQGRRVPLFLSVGGQNTTATPLWLDYAAPFINASASTPRPMHGPTLGGTVVTLHGRNFGLSGAIQFGRAAVPTLSWTHTAVSFMSPSGQGVNVAQRLTVALQSAAGPTWSYDPPVIYTVTPLHGYTSGRVGVDHNSAHGDNSLPHAHVVFVGFNFGHTPTIKWGLGVLEVTDMLFANHTTLELNLPEGQGNMTLSVQVAGQLAVYAHPFAYDPPVLDTLFPNYGPTSGCTLLESITEQARRLRFGLGGGPSRLCCAAATILLLGANFGVLPPVVSFGRMPVSSVCGSSAGSNSTCFVRSPCIVDSSHSAILLRSPVDMGANIPVVVGVEQLVDGIAVPNAPPFVTAPQIFNFSRPTISIVSPYPYNANGDQLIFQGVNYGDVENPVTILLNGEVCGNATWNLDRTLFGGAQYLTCAAPNQVAGYKNISLRVALQACARMSAFPCAALCISNASRACRYACSYSVICISECIARMPICVLVCGRVHIRIRRAHVYVMCVFSRAVICIYPNASSACGYAFSYVVCCVSECATRMPICVLVCALVSIQPRCRGARCQICCASHSRSA